MTSVSVFGPRLLESLDDIHKPSPLAAEPSSGDKPPRPAVDRLSSPDLDPAAPATAPTQSAVEDAAGFKGKSVFETLGIRIRLLEESQKKVDLQLKDRLSLALFQIHQWVAGIEDAMAAELEELAVSVRKSLGDAEQAAADLGDGLDVLEEVFVVVADLRNLLKVTEALVLGLLAAFAMTFAVAVFVLAVAFKPAERGVGTKRSLYRKRSRFGASR